jgi:hypothetical protein
MGKARSAGLCCETNEEGLALEQMKTIHHVWFVQSTDL